MRTRTFGTVVSHVGAARVSAEWRGMAPGVVVVEVQTLTNEKVAVTLSRAQVDTLLRAIGRLGRDTTTIGPNDTYRVDGPRFATPDGHLSIAWVVTGVGPGLALAAFDVGAVRSAAAWFTRDGAAALGRHLLNARRAVP